MKSVLIFPTGSLKAADRKRLAAEGFIAIEHDDPARVVSLVPSAPLASPDDLLMAAMHGIEMGSQPVASAFFGELHRRMQRGENSRVNE